MSHQNPVHVVCAVIVREDQCILTAKRPAGKKLGGLWEFPGGKVEQGEDPFSALEREIKEELDLTISKTKHLLDVHHDYEWGSICLSAYLTTIRQGVIKLHEHEDVRWCKIGELHELDWAPADLPILKLIQSKGLQ